MSVEDAFRKALKEKPHTDTSGLVGDGLYNRYAERQARREKKVEQELEPPKTFSNFPSRIQFFLKLFRK